MRFNLGKTDLFKAVQPVGRLLLLDGEGRGTLLEHALQQGVLFGNGVVQAGGGSLAAVGVKEVVAPLSEVADLEKKYFNLLIII